MHLLYFSSTSIYLPIGKRPSSNELTWNKMIQNEESTRIPRKYVRSLFPTFVFIIHSTLRIIEKQWSILYHNPVKKMTCDELYTAFKFCEAHLI